MKLIPLIQYKGRGKKTKSRQIYADDTVLTENTER